MAALPKWFHGNLSREEASDAIISHMPRYPGQPLWLVRKSSREPDDFVLSCVAGESHPGLKPEVKHIIIRVTSGDAFFPASYILQTGTKNQPSFGSLDQLLEFYKNPRAGPPAPIGVFVPATVVKQTGVTTGSIRSAPAQPVAPTPATTPFREVSHPTLAGPAGAAPAPRHEAPQTGLAAAKGGGLYQTGEAPETEELLCEGYLEKHRGVGKTRTRWFRLTSKKLCYYSRDAGELIASCLLTDISAISDLDKTQFRIVTREPFGTSNQTEMVLEAPNQRIKNKWLFNLRQEQDSGGGFRGHEGRLMVEGDLTKVQPTGTTSKTRWFVCTDRHFSYYKEEGSEIMGSVLLDNVASVISVDKKTFKVIANTRFTVTGAYEVVCRCESEPVRNKWLAQMQRVIPATKFSY